MSKKQQGFTIIELIIVVVILGLLAAAAIPRFTDVSSDAEDAALEGVAGGFASAVGIVRGEWELSGRPKGASDTGAGAEVSMDQIQLYVDGSTGYPVSGDNNQAHDENLAATDCVSVMQSILQGAPTVTTNFNNLNETRYFTYVTQDSAAGNDMCVYYLANTIKNETEAPSGDDYLTVGNAFVYNPRNGGVSIHSNNQ
ncbi:prepilin-type N-terminal cleavage/methylation domain-containing protein [Idiomarina sp. M1R2S28]|uniref:Prepilin-type N-terminal cleavage/methylation domain-containing protein n=1 Tax=Idiomarina rhizosphaerae TaxID=2961572 RepID=A0A9X2FT13_9GAMM|nr:prepilin-type N-terminal cleavage/methylation domain-containing protein [Idiomarina rhizosphaerae]MCP1338719.1 prepilin-type N-terminal cleavage/methylation domain-containing protein [Idiomarina rhizosphaerae]